MSTAADAFEAIAATASGQWTITRPVATDERASFLIRAADTDQHFEVTIQAPSSRQDAVWVLTLSRATVANRHGIPLVTSPDRSGAVRPVVVADDLLAVIRTWVEELSPNS